LMSEFFIYMVLMSQKGEDTGIRRPFRRQYVSRENARSIIMMVIRKKFSI